MNKNLIVVFAVIAFAVIGPLAGWKIGALMSEMKRQADVERAERNNSPEEVQRRAYARDLEKFTNETRALAIKLEATAAAGREMNNPGTTAAREARIEEMAEAMRRAQATPSPQP